MKTKAPIFVPGFNPPIPNMKDKNIKMRVKALAILQDGLSFIYANPVIAKEKMEKAMRVLKKGA